MSAMGIVGTIGSIGSNVYNNNQAVYQSDYARRQNYIYGDMQGQDADRRTRALYNDLQSPAAQIRQLKAAGLSPSVFFEGGGAGGLTQGAQGPTAAVPPQFYPFNPLEAAQINLMNAQARNLDVDSDTKEGKNALGQANLGKIFAEIGLYNAEREYKQITTSIQEIEKDIKESTKEDAIYTIRQNAKTAKYNADKLFYGAMREEFAWKWDAETFNSRVELEREKVVNLIADTALKGSQKQVNDQERARIIADTERIYNDLFYYADTNLNTARAYIDWLDAQIEMLPKKLEATLKGLNIEEKRMWIQAATDLLHTAGETIGLVMFSKGKGLKPQNPEFRFDTPMPQQKVQQLQGQSILFTH